jgi:hypothetical protein
MSEQEPFRGTLSDFFNTRATPFDPEKPIRFSLHSTPPDPDTAAAWNDGTGPTYGMAQVTNREPIIQFNHGKGIGWKDYQWQDMAIIYDDSVLAPARKDRIRHALEVVCWLLMGGMLGWAATIWTQHGRRKSKGKQRAA